MGRSSAATRGFFFLGLGAAVSAVLAVLQTNVLSLHLFTPIKWVVSVLFTALVVLISTVSSDRTRRADAAAKVGTINSALIGGAERLLRHRRLHEYGVKLPGEAAPAVRAEDLATIDAALQNSWLVCVIGPGRDATVAAAFTALRARAPDARLIAPVDADGLGTVLDGVDALRGAGARRRGRADREDPLARDDRRGRLRHASLRRRRGHLARSPAPHSRRPRPAAGDGYPRGVAVAGPCRAPR